MYTSMSKSLAGWVSSSITSLLLVVNCEVVTAQSQRLELGRRLQRLERAWEGADDTQRAASIPAINAAVNRFFSLNLSAAAKQLDKAWQDVRGAHTADSLERAVVHWQLVVSSVCTEPEKPKVAFQLTSLYEADVEPPENIELHLQLFGPKEQLVAHYDCPVEQALHGGEWLLESLPENDYELRATFTCVNQAFTLPSTTISCIADFESRLTNIELVLVDSYGKMDGTMRATLRDNALLLRAMQAGTVQETDYPAVARLQLCEAILQSPDQFGRLLAEQASKSDVWMSLAEGRKSVAIRMRAPSDCSQPLPVLFLFHGAGGSENMFFETYGAGRVVVEGTKRGWLVVAPRQGLLGMAVDVDGMLQELEKLFPLDRTRVMFVGHSMGAAQVIRQASVNTTLPCAAVALGGGHAVKATQKLANISWFVGAGQQDFGRGGAQQLHRSLKASGLPSTYHEYVDVEHLVVVQAAIDDVFQFLDARSGR